ncbi:MAG: hypothetical protein AAF722_20565 [Cyanobacteria bacterium P01_C01_bin.70]
MINSKRALGTAITAIALCPQPEAVIVDALSIQLKSNDGSPWKGDRQSLSKCVFSLHSLSEPMTLQGLIHYQTVALLGLPTMAQTMAISDLRNSI